MLDSKKQSCVISPSGQHAPGQGLELDDDVGQLEVSLLLEVGEHAGTEEDLALSHTEQVRVQL